jgi:hypothetical protein
MKVYWGRECIDPGILDLGASWSEWSTSRPQLFYLQEGAAVTHWIGGWAGPGIDVDDLKEKKNLGPTRARTLSPRPSSPQPFATPIALSRLPFPATIPCKNNPGGGFGYRLF